MAFLRQLKLLLWKNGLAVIRQPLWSFTLVAWPLIIFIIIGVTRRQFPPVVKETCFVGPRNLPSAGFFPFLQTLLCNTDSNCHNKSAPLNTASSQPVQKSSKYNTRSSPGIETDFLNFRLSKDSLNDTAKLIETLNNVLGSSYQRSSHNVSLLSTRNTTFPGDQESMITMLESMNVLKRAFCNMTLPMMNTTQPSPLSNALLTFCKSNSSVLEVSLNTLNQMLMELMLTKPDEMMNVVGASMMIFDQLQNQTLLWENLLAIPKLFSSAPEGQILASSEAFLTNIKSAMLVIQNHFPETRASVSAVHPYLAGSINVIHYVRNWPGKDVSISFGDIVTLQNDSLSEMVKQVLQNVKIPLDKAIGLTMDREIVHLYLCDNSSNPLWLKAACSTGTLDMLLGWISPDKVAKQVLLAWSKNVAPHDLSFAKGLLHSLMGDLPSGGQGGKRNRRSVDTQPQNIDEDLFLSVGQVVMDIIKMVPELDKVVQSILSTGSQSMNTATLALDTVEEMMSKVLTDADQLQMTYLMLLTNQSQANIWIAHVLNSVMEIIPKILSPESLTCEDVLGPFEWLLNTESIKIELWRSVICQNSTALQETLLVDWLPLIQQTQEVYKAITGQTGNVTLATILSQWHMLRNNTVKFGMLLDGLVTKLSGKYWMNWMPENNTHHATVTLQQSISLLMVNFGETLEKSQIWPEVKNYFEMLYWILNYKPSVTTQPANCSINSNYTAIHCDNGLKWPQFAQAMVQALMSPNQDTLVNCLKGSVNLLQHVYGDCFKQLAGSYLKQEIKGGDALSVYLINLMQNLDGFVNTISMLPDQNITNPDVMVPLIGNLLQSAGLKPLLPLFLSDGPVNVSAVLHAASKIGRLNQHIFTFNETDPAMPQLEWLIMQFLSLEGNLTMSVSNIMGHTLLTYSDYFNPEDIARVRKAIRPFTNQTSAGIVEAIVSAMELLKTVTDAPNGDPTNIVLGYISQLVEFVKSLYRLKKIKHLPLPNGQLSVAEITDLHLVAKDFLDLLTPESLQNLTQAGPDAAHNVVVQKFVAFLPAEIQQDAVHFLQDFKALQDQMNKCAAGQNCLAGIADIFSFLDQILDMMLSTEVNVTISLASTNAVLVGREREEILSSFFPLLLSPNDAASVETFKHTLHFITLLMATTNITVSDVQNALRQSNLTLEELNSITALAGAANIRELMANVMKMINVRQCFEAQRNSVVTAQCVMGLINGVSGFLTQIPALRNETAILSFIPFIINNTISGVVHANFSSNPNVALAHTLKNTLASIKMNLQLNHLNTSEIMNELRMVEGLIELVANTEPFTSLNSTLLTDALYAQKVYLQMVEWYLKRLENITSTSSVSQLLHPFFSLTQMQVTLQLAQLNFSMFMSNQIEFLINVLQYPIDGAGVKALGLTTVKILRHLFENIKFNLEAQNTHSDSSQMFNTTILNITEVQVNLYLDLIQKWMKQPNVTLVLGSMLQWGNPTMNVSTPVTDLQLLLGTMVSVLSDDQQAYLSIIGNITNTLRKALMVAEQPGGLQSDNFFAAIMEVVQLAMQVLTSATGPLPRSVQHNVLEIVEDSLNLIVQPNISYASSRNISLLILKRAESVIQQTLPDMVAEYLLPGIKVITTYFESISVVSGPDSWNQIISLIMVNLGEMIEKSQLWPEVKNYFQMFYWILNYTPSVTTQPANCSINVNHTAIHCDNGLKWPQFVQAMIQALMSPIQDTLVNCLKGSVNLLQHVYGDCFKQLAGSYLKQEIKGGDALSVYLINLMQNLDGFVNTISMLPDQNITNPDVMVPLIGNLLQSAGLKPLLPLFLSDGPVNVSAVLHAASKIGRLNQHIFTFNETDPAMPQLEWLIMQFLSLEGNLTMSVSNIMGHTLLTYSDYFNPEDIARVLKAIRPFTNQTSAGIVEAIVSAIELLKTVTDAPNGDPTNIVLGYISQLVEFVKSLYRLKKIKHLPLPNGQLSVAEITDLHLVAKDFLDLLTPESLQNLTQAGPDAAQNVVVQKFVAFLPAEIQQDAVHFLQDFKALQDQMNKCAAGQNCLAGIADIFSFLDQILDMMLSTEVNVTISLASTNAVLVGREREEILSSFFPLLLSPNDAASVETFKHTLHFITLLMTTTNITVSDVQNALRQSNLTLEELNSITALAGAANIRELMANVMKMINVRQCFEAQRNSVVTAQCVMGLINGVSGFLTQIPALRNETAILSFIPLIINNTISGVVHANFSSNPNVALAHTLKNTLASIKMNLQLNHLNTSEIMNELRMVEALIELVANTEPFTSLNSTLLTDALYAQKVYLQMVEWYLKRLENITSTSSVSQLLHPFFSLTQMQVTLQLAQLNFSMFMSNQIEFLINVLQYPIDGAGVKALGLTTVKILRHLFENIKFNLEAQNTHSDSSQMFNTTILNITEVQVNLYLDLIQKWMKQPNVTLVLGSMLQWGNPTMNVSTPVTDLQLLLGTMVSVLSDDQQAYLSIIGNITNTLRKALMVAEQPGGLQSDNFFAAIMEVVQLAMQVLTSATGPLPRSVQHNVLEIVEDSLNLIVQPNISYASSRNISLLILKRAESVIQQTLPDMVAEYLLPGIKVITTYFESISVVSGPDSWNQIISLIMVNLGEMIEKSQLWPEVKNYFQMFYWILNYTPSVTTQPANCSINVNHTAIHCDNGLKWPQFVQAMIQALMSPIQDTLVNCLKGSVNLLQHVYGDCFKQLAGSYLKQEIKGGDALSAYLINLMQNLDGFVNTISMLPDQNITNPDVMVPLIGNLLQSAGLKPLLPLFLSDGPVNVSAVLHAASKIGRLNQHIFTFNETDPAMPQLEWLIMQFLSLEGNLTMSVSNIMGHTLLTYSDYFNPEDIARVLKAIRPFTNQTSAGIVEAIVSAMELLKTVTDAPNGDPTNIVLGYISQLVEFVKSLYRLKKIKHLPLPNGQLSVAEITDLHLVAKDFLDLLTPESLQNLTQAGPDAAQNVVVQKFVAFLPAEIQQDAVHFLQDFKALQDQMNKCAAGQNCLAGIADIFSFLDQILDMMLSTEVNVTISLASTNAVLVGREREEIFSSFFPLLLSPNDAASVETFKHTLHFITLLMTTTNITVSDVQNALRQSNLTLEELNSITALAGAANIRELMANVMKMINVRQCFEAQLNSVVTAQCVMGLINGVSGFLTQIPALRNETAILSFIPLIINNTISGVVHANFSSNPNVALAHTLKNTLASIKMNLQLNHLNTSEIMNELRMVEGLIELVANTEPFTSLNSTLLTDALYAQKVYLQMVEWYLKRLENITSTSSVSELLHPFFSLTQMQVALQLAQLNFSMFMSNQIEFLINVLQYPIDGAGVKELGLTTVKILRHLFENIKFNLEAQNTHSDSSQMFNTTILNITEVQVNLYLDLIQKWMKQPNVTLVLGSMLQWGNPTMNVSTPVTDLQLLLGTMVSVVSDDQQAYLSIIGNITNTLRKALMVAEQPGGLQSDNFFAAIMEVVQLAMQVLTSATGPLPRSVQHNVLEIVEDSLNLIVQPNISYASSRNISLLILKRAESVIQQTLPDMVAEYLLPGIKVITTYFESISVVSGPDSWNQMILAEMETVHSLLPPNSTAQAYVSVLINITHFVLESGQGNMNLWASFENATVENLPVLFGQMGKLLRILWPLVMGGSGSHTTAPPLEGFAHLVPVLEQVMTEKADQDTWDKLEKMIQALLSTLTGTELWDPSVIPQFEKIVGCMVNNMQAEDALIMSLQMPMVTLIRDFAQFVNSSHFNLSDVSERMELSITHTLEAAEQANHTLECSEVLKLWEPVRKAVGLSNTTMSAWCNISLQSVFEAYDAAHMVYTHMNTSHTDVEQMSANAASARIVNTLKSLYQADINSSFVKEQLVETLLSQFSELAGQPLSHEAQLHWYKQLQQMQLESSLSSFRELSDELVRVAPFVKPYMGAIEKALNHLMQDGGSSQDIFTEAAMIFLSSANITSGHTFPTNSSQINEAFLTDTMKEAIKLVMDMKLFGDTPRVYHALEQFLASNSPSMIVQKLCAFSVWLSSTQASGPNLLIQAMPKIYDILKPLFSVLTQMWDMDMPVNMQLFEDLPGNIIAMLRQLVTTSGLLSSMDDHMNIPQPEMATDDHERVRKRREAALMMAREPVDDFIDLLYIDYSTMFKAISVPVTTTEIMETVNMFFANPDLRVLVKGATSNMPWYLNASREDTIDAALEMLSFFTLPGALQMSSMDLLTNATDLLPGAFPFSSVVKKLTRALATESQETLMLMQETIQIAAQLLHINLTDPRFKELLAHLGSKVCILEETESMRLLMSAVSIQPGQLCHTFLPSLQILVEDLMTSTTSVKDAVFQTIFGDPHSYNVQSNWSSGLSEALGFNTSSLRSLHINVTSPGAMTVGEIVRDKAAFFVDVQQHMDFDPAALHLLMRTTLPNNNVEILSWLVNLRHCKSTAALNMNETDLVILKTFCSLSVEQWYSFSLLMARHLNVEKLIYRMVLSDEVQSLVGALLHMAEAITDMMNTVLPAVGQLQTYMASINDLNLVSNNEFNQMVRGQRTAMRSKATFVTLSRVLCNKGILALLGISKLPTMPESNSSFSDHQQREEMIERFKIPPNASPFCMNMYLDMVNTTGGAIAWAFLKPMLMGHILYSPDTPVTRAIMEKANGTLQEFANLRKHSKDWIESANYIIKSAEILSHTLPMLQNSLGNSFVENFIEMQTDINVGRMKETLSNFSNMTVMLEKNKHIMNQITTLSNLMVNISSCIKFDRYRGYDSADELNTVAQDLAKNRDLYGSVIFKLPKDDGSSRKRQARSSSSTSALPPNVRYTIRMHMDNVMRTDRVRDPYFYKSAHISARQTLRYNRGFIYLQENIDRAIIEMQTGQRVTETAVQLQPFPYPCHFRDEYLEAISFVFPLMLMLAWVLFVADFVKKLVHERELRLHEYMKMMGVNPLSHFFAWFLECAAHLLLTVFLLTLVLKYGKILPYSDGFLLFLYLCDYALSVLSFSYLVSSFFDKTYIAGLSGSLLYIFCFFPFIVVVAMESNLNFFQKSALSLFSPTCFSYASQYISRYESQGEGIQWSNSYTSPVSGDTASFGWLCWMMLIDSILYFLIGVYIRMVFPGKYGISVPWYFPFRASFWADLCCCIKSNSKVSRGLFFANIMQKNQPVFSNHKGKGHSTLSPQDGEDFSELPVGVALHCLSKIYGDRVALQNLNLSFYEGHVTSLLGHNGAGKTTTMSLLTGLFSPSSGSIEVYGRNMQTNIEEVRRELGVCMQYDVLFDHMTTKEHLLLYGQIKAPHWSRRELLEQVRTILEETDMYAHRHKRVGNLSGGMRRKLSISIAFIGGSRLVVLDEPTTGVDPCSRRSIWDIVIQHKKSRTVIMSTHHLDEAEVLSDRIALLERGGLKCCGSPFLLKDQLGQGYKVTLTKKMQNQESERIDNVDLKAFIQAHVPEARLKEAQGNDLVYSLPPFTSSNASSYRSLLKALDSNLDALQLGGYGISDTTLEEVFLELTHENTEPGGEDGPLSISQTVSDTDSIDSFPSDSSGSISNFGDNAKLTGSSTVSGVALAWQQMTAILIKRFHHSRRDWKGLISQILLPVLFMVFAMGLGAIKSDLQHYPTLELSPALYNFQPSYSFFSNHNPNSAKLKDSMMSYPGIDNACLDDSDNPVCTRSKDNKWVFSGNSSKAFSVCKCSRNEQICPRDNFQPPHKKIPSAQIVYNLSGINVEHYLVATANDFIRNRYGGFTFGMPLPPDLKMDLKTVPKNRTLSKVWFNPEGHHTMPAYLNSMSNLILRANLPANKDPRKYAISVSSHPYFGRADDEDSIVQGMLQILVSMCVLTGFSITTASFAIYEVSEHHSGSKRLQHISGVSEPFYWAVNFCYDMVIYMIPVALTVAVTAAFQISAFTDRENLGAVALLLVLFGFATFPWMYLLSGVFKDAEMAFIAFVCINLFISINTIMSTSILFFMSQLSMHKTEAIHELFTKMSDAFLIFPQFSFGNGLMKMARMNVEVQLLSGYGIDAYKSPFSMDGLGWMFIASFIQGVVFFSLRLLLNKFLIRKVRNLLWRKKTVPHVACEDEDEDVAAEHLRVCSGAAGTDILQVNQLTKVYQHLNKKVHAVKRLSVGIPAGECFGLLGVNGAGKTTTFKMLTGDVSPTEGTAQTRDCDGRLVDIMECRNKGINIGYCPQVDALDNLLTGEEHLYFYARIRGISKREIDRVVNYLLKRLELSYHRNIITDGYSCGTRRKLSTALALVGQPQILLLDEPSSGMDPRTKRHLWKIISQEVKGKCAVVLTSHSMEECEALCSRLAIMVKGQFRCLGSLQHIKNRFGSGFTVKMYLSEASDDAKEITGFMQQRFPSTYLKDQHSTMVEYHIPVAPGGVADIFDQLESNKNDLKIKHFSVSQTTLDEVFINFAVGKVVMESISLNSQDQHHNPDSIKAVDT